MWLGCVFVLTVAVCFCQPPRVFGLQDVTADLFGSEFHGTVAAFGDFNSDKQTDIFIIREQSELVIFLADLAAPYFKLRVRLPKELFDDEVIDGVVPGDFDGDSQMDVLLTTHPKSKNTEQSYVTIYWGNKNQTLDKSVKTVLNKTFVDEPLVMDFDGDMIPDIFGTTSVSPPQVCYLKGRNVVWQSVLESIPKMRIPHSHAFIDLNKDFTADLFLTLETGFETWINQNGNFTKSESIRPEGDFKILGQSAFVDFDGDGSQDHLLPVCMDETCKRSAIFLTRPGHSQDRWLPILTDFQRRDTLWGFVPPTASSAGAPRMPITLHLGDYNLDGFPDALAILRNTSGSAQQAFLLENVPCSNTSCRDAGRTFRIHWDQSDLSSIRGAAVIATFFDIYEDGILDMIVLSKEDGKEELTIHALKNNFEADAYFVKVIVLSGLCSNDCPGKVKPFGVNQPGPYVMYTSVDSNGYLKNASAGQLSQSAHLSLQLPYTVLGLGRSANFLDHLYVGIPRPLGDGESRKQEWTAIIPNSQLIVIPYPHDDPRSWSAKLYLTPSNIVLLTAIALIGVCIFILVIIGILHWQEKKADDREKRQEAHRFHFDAM
ncbi:T-cell immunomodulatory protein [Scleropages formosus]|uniref:Integrin alpha FG-GAP repeat containing 1 n=1 Tax=Scleropages formosus TaxID=113540 RepID=A0A8C9S000_SCLFO|nr:T-cell immunomodulatory protein [Scleropages formosus]